MDMSRGIGAAVKRSEDVRFITGRTAFVDDIHLENTSYAAVLRSPYAHARITRVDVSKAQSLAGIRAAFTSKDLGALNGPLPASVSPLPQYPIPNARTHYALAQEKVRYVGEPVAFVVADSRYLARDAIEQIEVEYDPLPAVVDVERALEASSPLIHIDLDSNVVAHHVIRVGDADTALSKADFSLKERFVFSRGAAHSIEARGVVASYDAKNDFLMVWDSTQAPIPIRNGLARLFGKPEHKVRVVAPDVGGGFGPKIMLYYPEEILVPFASMRLNRPVKWIEERREYSLATNQERIQIHNVEVAFNRDGRLLGLKDSFLVDNGAYAPYGVMVPIITLSTLPGPYKIPNYFVEFRSVYTNKTIVSPVRGAGRPTAVFVMERVMDVIASRLGIDRAQVRSKNLIQPNEFPYDVGVVYQDAAPTRYDSGNYPVLLQKLLQVINYQTWADEKAKYTREGSLVGIGIGLYVEGAGVGPYEMARVRVEPSGRVIVATGVGTQGQGHFTTLAQIAAQVLTVDLENVDVITGDTAQMPWGIGTFASRSATIAGNAVFLAAKEVRRKALQIAERELGRRAEELELNDGRIFVKNDRSRFLSLAQVATLANPLRGTLELEPGLEATNYFSPTQSVFSSGAHGAIIEVDPETYVVKILRYVIVHDCGKVINPIIVEGQLHGGFSNGLGAALYEEIIHDEFGQPLTTTFMDYRIPSVMEMPGQIETYHLETPSPLNPLGVKGVGEAGVIPVPAVVASAIENALNRSNLRIRESPLNPSKLWSISKDQMGR